MKRNVLRDKNKDFVALRLTHGGQFTGFLHLLANGICPIAEFSKLEH
jgi:hypothetical protein